ncbi:lamin tail domain-containing protein [Methylotenera sp.]|uniref:lamin tail domain-containing protein n=1 Tax=Methylotenera sp. TaxID=2051956 RepID=UPI00272F7317|nr:lamin tail domain-containing protein [Methylotenera sp.]MDP2071304.1 lamin tail domain-containing protein [Methylotenera sp.]MDP2229651.1 lamin tail domain-containing protein [Methylotenera sp.]MDP3005221.1 lamin tail domain-containing protein [Methylotenera sp.]MDP3818123.1 lamin tail domain-containing protein [Methylotenera sp.]
MNIKAPIRHLFLAAIITSAFVQNAHAANTDIKITEWLYTAASGASEFMEFTNLGTSSIDLAGWSFSDKARTPGHLSLSSLGTISAGESFIITDKTAFAFSTEWNLASTVKVLGGNTVQALGRDDEINIYDNTNTLIDRLTYNDQASLGPRAHTTSARPGSFAALGANNANLWVLSAVGDGEGTRTSLFNSIGSPGSTSFVTAVPEPQTYALMMAGLGLIGFAARKRQGKST